MLLGASLHVSLCCGRRGANKPFNQIGEGTDFAVGRLAASPAYGEGADEDGVIANRRTDTSPVRLPSLKLRKAHR
jgi:hypothetical protein